jgi:hypothetical protein
MMAKPNRDRRWTGGVCVAALLLVSSPVAAADDEAHVLARRAVEVLPHGTFRARAQLTTGAGAPRELEVRHKMIDGAHASYMEVTAPEDLRGLRFLFIERPGAAPVQYVKVAAARRHVLISETGQEQPFLDSAFYIADFVHPDLDAYAYTVVGDTEILGRRCRVIEGVPKKPQHQGYGKQRVALDAAEGFPLRREFFDLKQQLFKVWTVDKLEKVDGQWTQLEQRMVNVSDGRESRMVITEIHYGVSVPDEVFSPEYLLR